MENVRKYVLRSARWTALRHDRDYVSDWRAHAGGPAALEPAPFAVRTQTRADLGAARWGLLAWEDPFGDEGPASPFWSEAPVALAVVAPPDAAPETEPFAVAMARDGATLSGLRLPGGALVLKLEWGAEAAQLRVLGAAMLDPAKDRVLLCRPFELAQLSRLTRMADVRAQVGTPPGKPPAGCGRPMTTRSCFSPWTGIWRRGITGR